MESIVIEYYQLDELYRHRLYINKYSLDLLYSYELNRYWKEFFFDLIDKWTTEDSIVLSQSKRTLLDYLKENYNNIIKENNIKIDIRDYIELTDYVTIEEWLTEDNHKIQLDNKGVTLIIGA